MNSYRMIAEKYGMTADQVSTIVRLRGITPTTIGRAFVLSESQEREIYDALTLIGKRRPKPKLDRPQAAVA